MTRRRRGKPKLLMISAVAERYGIHPQTLRLYEREGLISPTRSSGNTRLYDEEALDRLETILTLTRDMGVNLAGVEVILRLQRQMREMEARLERLEEEMKRRLSERAKGVDRHHALVKAEIRALIKY